MKGKLYLEDGSLFEGIGVGACTTHVGELVFNTSMVGYEKILTDPSYSGQVITMTYPLIGNYGVNKEDFESNKISALGFITRESCDEPSNFRSELDLEKWLCEMGIPGVCGIDTRMITKRIRTNGTVKCVITTEDLSIGEMKTLCDSTDLRDDYMKDASWVTDEDLSPHRDGNFNVAVIDLGIKKSILKSLEKMDCNLHIFKYDFKAEDLLAIEPDGIFISNGPGDPEAAVNTIEQVKKLINSKTKNGRNLPIFGICMGHQILALAVGGETYKMKYGHRGGNHGVYSKETGKSYITSQNHGYAVKAESLIDKGVEITEINLNDNTVEGMSLRHKPVFSVQYHPEANPGPTDSHFLFKKFLELMQKNHLRKVLIIGSGPIIIGQAAEFDYAGTQCCKAIKEEGIETILVNSNPATIMTDKGIADKVYIEPLTADALEEIVRSERPDGILAGFGGQTGLNLAMALDEKGVLKELGIALLGVNKSAIENAEDREKFKELMGKISEPVPKSTIATTYAEAKAFEEETGFPLIIRPAYTLGGTGGGIAKNYDEYKVLVERGIEKSAIGQILIEESVAGWKEIEYEVIRDHKGNCIIICAMENLDPVGVHTGDSIVVAPTQTLSDNEYQMLRNSAIHIVNSLEIEGGCNVQFALDPNSEKYIVIEVNPRVSRSSALASKAAGYPIAKIAAKIAIGYSLDQLSNYITQGSSALFEPVMDYCVVKFPKWPFDKFTTASKKLGTQMKATGEVMSICRTFESALLKAITSLENKVDGIYNPAISDMTDAELEEKILRCDNERIFVIAEVLRRDNGNIDKVHELTGVDMWFLNKIRNIVVMEKRLENEEISAELIKEAETIGFTENEILKLTGIGRAALQDIRSYNSIYSVYKMVDTCAGEFDAATPYYYSCFDEEDESAPSKREKVLVVGSGPIRIGQGIEFDYCCVQGVWALKDLGYESIIVNNNPETVSTDFDTADKLYFEALHVDDVMNVIKKERPYGVILQFGGQTALNLAESLSERGINILGTNNSSIDLAEDRGKFSKLLEKLSIPTPEGFAITRTQQAEDVIKKLGYPVIVRPSFVIGGRAMQVVYNAEELYKYLTEAVSLSEEHPVLIDKYVEGKEFEVDAIGDGEDLLIPGIMEHIERTGVHSGDSISVYPPYSLPEEVQLQAVKYSQDIAKSLKISGLINIQYVYDGKAIYVIEVNPRASRTIPILSKVTGVPMVKLAVDVMLGKKLKALPFGTGLYKKAGSVAVKVPVFSNSKLTDVDVALGPEMRSTGEVLGIDDTFEKALYKGFLGAGIPILTNGGIYVSLRDHDKTQKTADIMKKYSDEGFSLYGSKGTSEYLSKEGVKCEHIEFNEVAGFIGTKINAVINVPNVSNKIATDMFPIRRLAIEKGLPVLTCMDTAAAYLEAVAEKKDGVTLNYSPIFE